MSYVVLYRKYRPDAFKDVLGQDHIVALLESAVKNKKVAHAYLFSGPRGTGKTSIARIFAKALGCEPEDLYEIDGASNRGIDEIRALKEAVNTLPFRSPVKVYVIDEVHMLTKEAFNALLKTLEEPPEFAVFILATTELHKVPETIISRCQSFSFKKPSEEILRKMVKEIAKKEGVKIDDDATTLVSFLGEGSFRDTLGYLEQIIQCSKDKIITRDEVEKVTGAPKFSLVLALLEAFLSGNTDAGFAAIDTAQKQNIDMRVFTKLLMKYTRYAMLLVFAPEMTSVIREEAGDGEFKEIERLVKAGDKKTFPQILYTLIEAYENMRHSPLPVLSLELALAKVSENIEP